MQNLLSELEKRAKSMDVQIKKAKPMTEDEAFWAKLKGMVDNYPASTSIVGEKFVSATNLRKTSGGKCEWQGKCGSLTTKLTATLYTHKGYEVVLEAIVCPHHDYKAISYVAINSHKNVVYVRDIIKKFDVH